MEKDITLHKHHIVPRHMGGMDEPWNIMELSRKDHCIAHMILYKLYGKRQDLNAARLLSGLEPLPPWTGRKNPGHSERMKGDGNPMYGYQYTDEQKEERRIANTGPNNPRWGMTNTPESNEKRKRFGKDNHFYNKKHTDESLAKIRTGVANQKMYKCDHCDKLMIPSNLLQHKRALEKKNGTTN